MRNFILIIMFLTFIGCDTESWIQRDFWLQIYPKIPIEQFDPFKNKCTFISEEFKSFGSFQNPELWVVRHYICPSGIF